MKTVSTALQAHLQQDTTTLATCWQVTRRDGRVFRFTDHDQDLTVEGDTFKASTGFARTAIESDAGYAVDNMDIDAIFDSEEITETDLRAGKFDYAECLVFAVNWADTSQGKIILRRGWIGEVQVTQRGLFSTELRGLVQPLNQNFGDIYTPLCRTDLGSPQCGVKLIVGPRLPRTGYAVGDYVLYLAADGTYSGIREVTTAGTTGDTEPGDPGYDLANDGTVTSTPVTFTDHWVLGRITAVTNQRRFEIEIEEPTGVTITDFEGGLLHFATGANLHFSMEVKNITDNTASATIALFLQVPYVPAVGDRVVIVRSCDKRRATCRDVFANVVNFRGEPDLPGQDAIMAYPDAK